MRSIKAAFILMLSLLFMLSGPAAAAKRKIEFPSSDADRIIKVDLLPPKTANKPVSQNSQREARVGAIVDLFTRRNPKLSQKRAAEYAEYIIQASEKFGQDPFVIASMIVHESTVRYDAVSRGGDYGLMQVRWSVHKKKIANKYPHIKTAKDVLDPKYNILIGTEIFSTYRASAGSGLRQGLLSYSAGNKKLADKVLNTKQELEKTYQKLLATGKK